jgi:hypothetical protein
VKRSSNPREVIVLSSDDDTRSVGNASNPIVLDSDDEAEPSPKARAYAVTSFLDAVQNKSLKSPTRSIFLADPHSPQRGSSPPMSSESEESVLAALTTTQGDNMVNEMSPSPEQSCKAKTPERPPSRSPSTNSVMRVDSPSPSTDLMTKAKTQPPPQSPKYDPTAETPAKRPFTTPRPESERPSGPPLSSSPMNPVPRIGGTSHSPTSPHVSVSSSPGRQRETAVASASSPTVRGTLYSGPSGLWKNFFKATIAKPVSAPRSPPDILPQWKERPKKRSGAMRAELPNDVVSLTHTSPPSNKPVGIKQAQSTVVDKDLLGSFETRATVNDKSKTSVSTTGELFGPCYSME